MNNPTVSFIMGIYNCENTLQESLDSILNQTYTDWEMVMCDDGSKDRTYEIAQQYVDQYPNKFVLLKNEKNMGLNYTLNKCLKKSRGIYIARMDGDDISLPTRLEKEIGFLEEHPEFAIVSTANIMFDENGEWGISNVIEYPQKKDFCKHSPVFSHPASVIKKSAFEDVGGYTVDKRLLRVEDCHLWFKLYAKGYLGANLKEPLYKFRDDRNAIGRRTFQARWNGCYVMYAGFKLLNFKWYMYIYVLRNFVIEMLKVLCPTGIYKILHKRKRSNLKCQ